MTIRGKRIFNYRPLVIFAVALALGIVIGEALYGTHVALIVCLCALAFLFVLIFSFVKRVRKYFYIPLALLVGLTGITASNAVYDANCIKDYNGEFTATVASEIIVENGRTKFYVSDISCDGNILKYKAFVYIYGELEPDFNAGDVVRLSGKLASNPHKKFDSYYVSNRAKKIGYFANADSVVKLSEGKPAFPLNIQMTIKKLLYVNNDAYTAGICQALLLGDKGAIDDGAYENIAASGLAHVLAVSGLHITALAAALYFILRKIKVNSKISFVVVTVLTFLYSMLCSFTASSLRAVIMTAVLMFASAFGLKKGSLSSLSLAAILIMLFRPTAVMEVGFLLSFVSVLGIFMFYKPFERAGMKVVRKISPKREIGKKLATVCALSFSTNIATLPLVGYFFGRIPTLFVISNFFVLPYVMFMYAALIILTIVSLITTVGGIAGIMRFIVYPFKLYVTAAGGLPFASVPVSASIASIILYLLIMIFISRYVFVQRRTRVVGAVSAAALSVVVCALAALV